MKLEVLEKDHYYHIFNRGINGTNIFQKDENKHYFLKLANKYLDSKVAVLAYCLMDNHFHMAIRILEDEKSTTQAFSNLFNAYAKAYNKRFDRTGSLFEKHFKRIRIKDETYLRNLIVYIHKNPQNHAITTDFTTYEFSSYSILVSNLNKQPLSIKKEEVIAFFEDVKNMKYIHNKKLGDEDDVIDLQGFENLAGPSFENLAGPSFGNPEGRTLENPIGRSAGNNANQQNKHPLVGEKTIKDQFYGYIQTLQNTITSKLEKIDGEAKFKEDLWDRQEGGGGRSRIIQNGKVFEKGGVNISAVHGPLPKSMQEYFRVPEADFFACGLSLVIHPQNPMVPTVHANWRYFEMYDKHDRMVDQWFGGGQDLTPYYLFDEDTIHFHSTCKTICDQHNIEFYKKYKAQCDSYFWNAHREEARGVGGLFFDYCKITDGMSMQDWYSFVTGVGNSFLEAYVPIVEKRKNLPYTKKQRDWQEIRRGRYVEFNLVHDKGTLFGLKTNGRIESILMSLPPHVQWVYDHHPEKGSEEERLLNVLQEPRDWV